MSYRVFLGAPSAQAVDSDPGSYRWQTYSSPRSLELTRTESFILPPATLEAASRRISLIYENALFDSSVELEDTSLEHSLEDGDISEAIPWPLTVPHEPGSGKDLTFLLNKSAHGNNTTAFLDSTRYETQGSQSFDYSNASSIAQFPTFHFSLQSLTLLVNLLLAVLEVEGPDFIRIKKGADAGKEVGILKLIMGDEGGNVCKLTAWRDTAEEWGGLKDEDGIKRGDIIHIENVLMACEAGMSPTLTASPNLKSKVTICYRTMPHAHEDGRLRPDLRLGDSDPCVRRVSAVVRWFENKIGLPASK
ncbi:hypothetical protein BKA70DRAFT_1370826 [Coprinopsis sp. MPI-PUGE-AT-0042]|nr:hypothetical protein BKA70DRAFT_1370826 [Coprinopsis sp. MPI-PUGE-AT-0042]